MSDTFLRQCSTDSRKMCNFRVCKFTQMGKINIRNLSSIRQAAEDFLRQTEGVSVYAFYGTMGAGKTTFISALCSVLGVVDEVASPTFTIVNEYRAGDGRPVYHFDFYRIEKLSEVFDIGYEEYVCGDGICLMEWPERIEEILPENALKVYIIEEEDGSRTVSF